MIHFNHHTNQGIQETLDRTAGSNLHGSGVGINACTNLTQVRGWLGAANVAWLAQNGATLADHEAAVAAVQAVAEGGAS